MSVIITGEALKGALEAVKKVTDAIDTKASQAQADANSALTASQNAQSTANQASSAASVADTKATNAASAAATADGKAVQAQTTANSALSAAQTAQSTADGKQSKLYKHVIHLGHGGVGEDEDEIYVGDCVMIIIDNSNANLTPTQIATHLNDRDCEIKLVPASRFIPLDYHGTYRADSEAITGGLVYMFSTSGNMDDDSCAFTISNITQTVTAM